MDDPLLGLCPFAFCDVNNVTGKQHACFYRNCIFHIKKGCPYLYRTLIVHDNDPIPVFCSQCKYFVPHDFQF